MAIVRSGSSEPIVQRVAGRSDAEISGIEVGRALNDASLYRRLAEAVEHCTAEPAPPGLRLVPLEQPEAVRQALAGVVRKRVMVTGTVERRLVVMENGTRWNVADLSGRPHSSRRWPTWATAHLRLDDPDTWLSGAAINDKALYRLTRPRVLLAALYRPEVFPLPRFPLAISDLARAARSTLSGQVRLMDMQLGVTLDDILAAVAQQQPDILGVSATFGQHDVMTLLLDAVFDRDAPPLVLAGGSLTARNERLLLDRYPRLLVARGAGEPTIQDAISYWHGDLTLPDIRGIGYATANGTSGALLQVGRHRRTATIANRVQTDTLPELDLLDATFAHRGVAQLETSRGCTNFCSFCPRGHKGTWSGSAPPELPQILAAMSDVFDRHPQTSRTVYLVDEEFIGRDADAVTRALAVADTVYEAGFRWESSCRVDQVVDPSQNRQWHIERVLMWRGLRERGLRRMLFGIESGVTSILERFNKETTAEQNALAIRTLTALGVPTRFTYITFDPLMSRDELAASYAFQTRTDLVLRPLPHLPAEAIVDGVRDEAFVAAHAAGRPLHSGISYMLVSMECLIGAAYTRRAEQAGLTGTVRPSMGRVDAEYADWRIGRASHHAQLWIDRNFAFDYTLKSLEKLLDGQPRHRVRAARAALKDAAATLLGRMLNLIDQHPLDARADADLDTALIRLLDRSLDELGKVMTPVVAAVVAGLPHAHGRILHTSHTRWTDQAGWQLINAADPCST
jgi:hypothetical protein